MLSSSTRFQLPSTSSTSSAYSSAPPVAAAPDDEEEDDDERRLKPNGWEKMRCSTLSATSAGKFMISPPVFVWGLSIYILVYCLYVYMRQVHLHRGGICSTFVCFVFEKWNTRICTLFKPFHWWVFAAFCGALFIIIWRAIQSASQPVNQPSSQQGRQVQRQNKNWWWWQNETRRRPGLLTAEAAEPDEEQSNTTFDSDILHFGSEEIVG